MDIVSISNIVLTKFGLKNVVIFIFLELKTKNYSTLLIMQNTCLKKEKHFLEFLVVINYDTIFQVSGTHFMSVQLHLNIKFSHSGSSLLIYFTLYVSA